MTLSDPAFVARQYGDAANLDARISLHQRFGAAEEPLPRWIFGQLDGPPDARILELGCGPGLLWTENRGRVPDGWSVTLTDASAGMVREAEGRLGPDHRFRFLVADAQEIPFRDGTFDAVLANHMLYHVPDVSRALSEAARVLRPDGRLYAATNGEGDMCELGPMRHVLDPSHPPDAATKEPPAFSLENGGAQLSRLFSEVSLRRRGGTLSVTEAEPLLEYLLCGATADAVAGEPAAELSRRISDLAARLGRELDLHGAIRITTDPGLFVARRPR